MIQTYNALKSLVESGKLPGLLVSYKDDFYRHDHQQLSDWGAPGVQYLWIVKDTGTVLNSIDVCLFEADRTLQLRMVGNRLDPSTTRVFHCENERVTELSVDQALKIILAPRRYQISGGFVLRQGRKIAKWSVVESRGSAGRPVVQVKYSSLGDEPLSLRDMVALEPLGRHIASREGGLWCQYLQPLLDSEPLVDRVAAQRHSQSPKILITRPRFAPA